MGQPEKRSPKSRERRVTRFWDARSAQYDAHYDPADPAGYSLRSRLELTLRLVGEGQGAVLDVGMGAGRLCEALARRGWSVAGVDASPEMVRLARLRMPEAEGRLKCGHAEHLPFDDAAFDVVTATGVLEYADVPRALGEIARVVRGDGLVVISFPNYRALYSLWKDHAWYPLVRHLKGLFDRDADVRPETVAVSRTRFGEIAAEAGLSLESARFTSYLLLPAPLDEIFPGLTERLGRRMNGSAGLAARLLGTQVVYVARPIATAETSAGTSEKR